MEIYNLIDKQEFLNEVATLEHEEWAENKDFDKENRLDKKINKIKEKFLERDFCKLILIENDELIGFISIFPHDCEECMDLTPWYATMYVKKEHRGRGYSKILNNAVLQEAKNRNYSRIYLKTTLEGYYEKFGAKLVKIISNGEKIYVFEI